MRWIAIGVMSLVVLLPAVAETPAGGLQPIAQVDRTDPVESAEPTPPPPPELVQALDDAAQIWDSKRVLIPAVFQAGPRRGAPVLPADGTSYNGTVRVTQSILLTLINQELFIYGLTEPPPGGEPHRVLVGRITLADPGFEDLPLATVQLDPAVASVGVANEFDLFTLDFGDDLISPEPPYQDAVDRLNAYVGTFSSESRIADASLDSMIGVTAVARVAAKCPLSCMGWFVGACKCYWDTEDKEWACGKTKTSTAAGCVGWCPG